MGIRTRSDGEDENGSQVSGGIACVGSDERL
jgi:hypothetical protein